MVHFFPMARCLAASATLCAVALPGLAQPTPIIITPSSIEQSRYEATTPVTIIDAETIRNANAGSVVELLRGTAGLHISDLFGDGSQATVDLRGFGPTAISNTLILLDGQRLNNSADQAAPDLSGIDLDSIERIEIMQGSAGVLYGNQAVGGVINIIRQPVRVDSTRLSARTGSYASRRLAASLERVLGAARLALDVSDETSDNYRDHNDSERQRLDLRVQRQHAGFEASIEYADHDEHLLTPGALLQDEVEADRRQSLDFYANDSLDTRTRQLRIDLQRRLDERQTLSAGLRRRVSDREFIQTFRPFAGSVTTQDRDNRSLSLRYQLRADEDAALASLILGVAQERIDYRLESVLGTQAMDQAISDTYVATQWRVAQRGRIDVGLRYSKQDADIDATGFDDDVVVASLGFARPVGDWRLFLRADQNYRFPTVEEHTNVPFAEEPGLDTQQGTSLEVGAELDDQDVRYRITLYQIRLRDEIAFDASGFANLNIERTRRHGLIAETRRNWGDAWSGSLSLTWLDTEISAGPFAGKELPLVPETALRVDAGYQFSAALRLNLEWLAVDEQVFGGDFANELGRLDAYQIVNAHLAWQQHDWRVRLRVNNLFNERYSESGSLFTEFDPVTFEPTSHEAFFPSPERNIWLSAEYSF